MATPKIAPFAKIRPMIYAYTSPGYPAHEGWTKIGYTGKQTVEARIHQQTNTADFEAKLEWASEARYTDGSGLYFTDHDFHDYLTSKRGIERKPKKEWFHITPGLAKEYFYRFRDRDFSDIQGSEDGREHTSYTLRAEQEAAVSQTVAYYESGEEPRSFLWNAKPRFGKTLSTYDFVRRIGARNVLIVTNRPGIANSWFDDFDRFIGWQTGYRFVSSASSLSDRPTMTSGEFVDYVADLPEEEADKAGRIAFLSLQDLKGSIYFGGQYPKLKWVRDVKWDVLVIDEAHEGVDTYKTDKAFENITRAFTLHLSGTPFKAIAKGTFRQDQIYNWSYQDEQEAKASWQGESANPYESLPRLTMLTYQLSKMIVEKTHRGLDLSEDEHAEYAFDLNEFFSTGANGRFIYEADVKKFLNALTSQKKFPFSTPELRSELAHTFWLLDRVESAKAMATLLKNHPVFSGYHVVLAAGDGKLAGDEVAENKKSFDKVIEAVNTYDKTITLSVGQLTTGVTVKPWTAVLMLSNMKSPAEYMQAAFRAQNPYSYEKDGKLYQKENAYLFDFAPERTLLIYDDFANDLSAKTAGGSGTREEHEANVARLLNFFPIYGENGEGEMVEVKAEDVLTIPNRIKVEEVIHRGFMSNFLFQNLSNIFAAPAAVRAVLEKLSPEETQGDKRNSVTMGGAGSILVDEHGEVKVPDGIVVAKTEALFGKKIPAEVDAKVCDIAMNTPEDFTSVDTIVAASMADSIATALTESMRDGIMDRATEEYGLKKKQAERLLESVQKEMKDDFKRLADDHATERRILQAEAQEKIDAAIEHQKAAKSEAELQRATREAESAQRKLEEDLKRAAEEFQKNLHRQAMETYGEKKKEVTETLEKRSEELKKKSIEEDVRAHLRGFSRTIPSFIMAYSEQKGLPPLSLAHFDDYTPDDVFEETTGISEDDFRFLRDGGERIDPETGEMKHFEGGFFNEEVFDESIKEFLKKKQELGDYFREDQEEDIFDYIPPQRTNQIFTPKNVVRNMVDALEKENPGIFDDPEKRFVDFYMKSGLYVTEIVKRLFRSEGLKQAYPEEHDRLKHILEHQVYGFAPSQIIYDIATAYIFGFQKGMEDISRANFVQEDTAVYAKEGKLEELVEKYFS